MSGGNIPYQLRPNKHVERLLFSEILSKIILNEPQKYAYISMGGPQLEDDRLMHQALGITTLLSFEENEAVYKRQLFNLRPSCVECIPKPINDFVDNFDNYIEEKKLNDKNLIVWLDYTRPNERRDQLLKFHTLLSKLQDKDVLKITLNANPFTLGEKFSDEKEKDLLARRFDKLQNEIGDYLPPEVIAEDMTGNRLAPILCKAIEIASEKRTGNSTRLKPLLLSLFSYQDGNHLMITATVRLTKNTDAEDYKKNLSWDYLPNSWTDIKRINIPSLTAKERLEIDSKLPTEDFQKLHDELPFQLDTEVDKSIEFLKAYATHYKRYPSYFQVVL